MKKTDIEKLANMDMAEWCNFFDNISKMAKHKTVTKKFDTIKPVLELCKEFAEENYGKISVEYGITGIMIIVTCPLFDVNSHDMPKYKELIKMVDGINISPNIDDSIDVVFDIQGVFQLPKPAKTK